MSDERVSVGVSGVDPRAANGLPVAAADASPPYNMGLARVGQTCNVDLLGVYLDKLRLEFASTCAGDLLADVPGIQNIHVGAGLRRGSYAVRKTTGWIGDRFAEGVVYFQVGQIEGAGTCHVVVEFNPRKVAASVAAGVGRWLRRVSHDILAVWVRRYDVAIDYRASRPVLLLDDVSRKSDRYGCGPHGCETERTGYRIGSKTRFQLYDKRAERRARGGDDPGDVVRFECQRLPASDVRGQPRDGGDTLRLGDLGSVECPFGAVTVRCIERDPWTIADVPMAMLNRLAVLGGVREAKAWARRCLSPARLETWSSCVLPEVCPSPREAFQRFWSAAVTRDCAALLNP